MARNEGVVPGRERHAQGRGYLVQPEGPGPFPAIVVVHENLRVERQHPATWGSSSPGAGSARTEKWEIKNAVEEEKPLTGVPRVEMEDALGHFR
jgi:hypothetical protein